jgi:hypothetical protein
MRCAYWLVEIIDVILPFHLAFTEALKKTKKKKKNGILLAFEIDLLSIRLKGHKLAIFKSNYIKKIMVLNFPFFLDLKK